MRAAVLTTPGAPLELRELPDPVPAPGQIALSVRACGVCRTDLHLRDAEIGAPRLPVIRGRRALLLRVARGLSDEQAAPLGHLAGSRLAGPSPQKPPVPPAAQL